MDLLRKLSKLVNTFYLDPSTPPLQERRCPGVVKEELAARGVLWDESCRRSRGAGGQLEGGGCQ